MKPHNIKHLFFLFPLLLLTALAYPQNPAFDSLANEIDRISNFKKTKSLELLDNLYQMAYSDPDSSLLIARCFYEEAFLYRRQGIVDTLLADRVKSRLDRKNIPPREQALLQLALADNLLATGEYSESFSLSLQALEKFKQVDDKRFMARALNYLGIICDYIKLYNLANYYFTEAINNITPEDYEYFFIKLNIFSVEAFINKNENAIDSMLYLLEVAEKEGKEEVLPFLYLNIGAFFIDTYPEKALVYFTKMQTLDFDDPNTMATLYANIGFYYQIHNDYPKALSYYKDAQKIMETNKEISYLSSIHNAVSQIFEQQNMLDSALFYARKNQELTRQLRSNTIAVETHQKYITTILDASQKDLIISEQKVALKNRQVIIIAVVSASAVLLILLFLLLINQQKRRKAGENRELTAKLEYEKLEKEKQEEIIDAKTRELTSFSMLVSNKNQLLRQIKGQIEKILFNEEDAAEIATKADEIIRNNLNVDEEWADFKMHFEKVHPHFFEKLTQSCSSLTEENLKMCAYFKIGMATKQIAQLLHVIPRSVIINRYRLKKKLQLPEEQDLDDFIRNL